MNHILWEMPFPSSSLTRGPNFFALMKHECELSFFVETEDGDAKAGIIFFGVEAYKCTYMTARNSEMIENSYDNLVRIEGSAWLAEVTAMSSRHYERYSTIRAPLQHLMITFDDGPCYEIVCTNFKCFLP